MADPVFHALSPTQFLNYKTNLPYKTSSAEYITLVAFPKTGEAHHHSTEDSISQIQGS